MDLWNTYRGYRVQPGFSSERLYIRVRNRIDTSLSAVDYSRKEVGPGEAATVTFAPEHRYLTVSNVTFELLVSVYDVNSRSFLVLRPTTPIDRADAAKIRDFIGRLRRPNIEVRLLGMQSGAANVKDLLDSIDQVQKAAGGNLMEVDLFGNVTRNIAFDARTGLSYDLMLLNRIYKPGELATTAKEADFSKAASKLKFV